MPHVLHVHTQHCSSCDSRESHSTLYLAEAVPTFGRAQKLLPCYSLAPTDPVHRVDLPLTTTPVCAHCASNRTGVGAEVWARWQETLARKAAQPRAEGAGAAKAASSLESLA